MIETPAPHPGLGRLAELIGDWEGEGTGTVEARTFRYRERVRFWHDGRPFLGYQQRTWAVDGGQPLHTESGYWRSSPSGEVELLIAHAIGDVEIEIGGWQADGLRTASASLHRTPGARPVGRLERRLWLGAGELRYELGMATGVEPAWVHLRGLLRRSSPVRDQASPAEPVGAAEAVLTPEELGPDPIAAFRAWQRVAAVEGGEAADTMALATAGADGSPSVRMVMLRDLDERGFVFHADRRSRKGLELSGRPRASLLFHWTRPSHRQVRVDGRVDLLEDDASDAYFASRPGAARISAWASPQSRVVGSRQELDELWREVRARFPDDREIPRPPFWGGYRVVPDSMEFWQGHHDRFHDRIRFRREGGAWVRERLAP